MGTGKHFILIQPFLLFLLLQICHVQCEAQDDDVYSLESVDEINTPDEIGFNPASESLSEYNNGMDKRHLGSIVKAKESWGNMNLLKRHLGSIVAGKPRSRMEKKYFGSIVNSKPRFQAPFGGQYPSVDDSEWLEQSKRHMGAVAKTNSKISKPFNRVSKSEVVGFEDDFGESEGDQVYDYPLIPDTPFIPDTFGFMEQPIALKTKRFLGSMARSGWFPRHFRGAISENPYKRHIGSIARWLPSKSERFDDGERFGLKRNIQAVKNIQFSAPNNNNWGWGRVREARQTGARF